MKIFIVIAKTDYESYEMVKAFECRDSAEEFKAECTAFDLRLKPMPYLGTKEFEEWEAEEERLRKIHPVGADCAFASYGYSVCEVDFVPA